MGRFYRLDQKGIPGAAWVLMVIWLLLVLYLLYLFLFHAPPSGQPGSSESSETGGSEARSERGTPSVEPLYKPAQYGVQHRRYRDLEEDER